ncbi:MAG: phosphoribosylglycinamide formyltransferase [Pseudomonadota bacterium]
MRVRTAILISGRGSNMMALVEAAKAADFPAEIALVLANKADAAGLEWAASQELETKVVNHRDFKRDREGFEKAISEQLERANVDLVCLAGFMRLLTPWFVERWKDRLINIHPSLLPSFKGLETHARAIEAGVKLHGCTVHFVRSEMDDGPIIAQRSVPVLDDDTPDILSRRVLEAEHLLYPHALREVAKGLQNENGWTLHHDADGIHERVVGIAPLTV